MIRLKKLLHEELELHKLSKSDQEATGAKFYFSTDDGYWGYANSKEEAEAMVQRGTRQDRKALKSSYKKEAKGWNADQWKKAMDRVNKWKQENPELANAKRAAKEKDAPWLRKQKPLPVPPKANEALSVPEKHLLKIARANAKMPPQMAAVLGGPDPEEAKKIIAQLTKKDKGLKEVSKERMAQIRADLASGKISQSQALYFLTNPDASSEDEPVKEDSGYTKKALMRGPDGMYVMCPCGQKVTIGGEKNTCGCGAEFNASGWIKNPKMTEDSDPMSTYKVIERPSANRWYVVDGKGNPAGFWEYKGERSRENARKQAEAKATEWTKKHSPTKEATGRPRPWDSPSQVAKKKLATKVVREAREPHPKEDLGDHMSALNHVADQLEALDKQIRPQDKDLLSKAVKNARFAGEYLRALREKY